MFFIFGLLKDSFSNFLNNCFFVSCVAWIKALILAGAIAFYLGFSEDSEASGDQGLVVHLRNSEECRKASKYETEEDMRNAIQKDNANVRKRKQRATQRKPVD